ncbi:MAG: polysaccharide biosynthesis tyrosine autokinase [Alphaproteobacteria bacterium]|nr:polysaccharide biosynthesis tyrosine autokinase [Alphaproteobacteria bacterium]
MSLAANDPRQRDFAHLFRWGWRVVWRGKWLIAAVLLLLLAPVVAYLALTPPLFTAEAEVLIEAPEATDSLGERPGTTRIRLSEQAIQTEAELLSSSLLIRRLVARLQLDRDPEFNVRLREPTLLDQIRPMLSLTYWLPEELKGQRDLDSLGADARARMDEARIMNSVRSRLQVRAQRRTHIVIVQFTSSDREKAARIVNTLTELYLLDRLEASFDDARRVTAWLSERLESLRRDVNIAEAAAETYRAERGLRRRSDRGGTVSDQQLTEINSRLVLARADLAQKSARLGQIRALQRNPRGVDTASDVLQSGLIQRLRETEAQLQRDVSEQTRVLGDRHPRLVGLRNELESLRATIAGEIAKIASSVQGEVDIAATGVRALEQELASLRQQTNVDASAEIRLRELERDADANRSLYEAFLARFKREAEQERIQRANARVVSPAEIPSGPSAPRTRLILLMALAVAGSVGIGLVFLLDRLDNAVRSADEAETLTGLPTLAMVPRGRRRRGKTAEDSVFADARSPVANAFRTLRTALALPDVARPDAAVGSATGARTVVVTSSLPQEGKTFISLSLARMFARAGERVLLIDADLHRPRLHQALGFPGERGLAQLLRQEATLDEVLERDALCNVDVLPAGRADHVEDRLFGTSFADLLSNLGTQWDRVIIDSPPVLAVSDARLLGALADQMIYVVKWNATPRDAVRNGVKLLRAAKAPLTGVVLSQVNMRKHARYGYGDYGQYYSRYADYYGR